MRSMVVRASDELSTDEGNDIAARPITPRFARSPLPRRRGLRT